VSQSGDRHMWGHYCANADELAICCTAGEHLSWQQQTSKLWLKKTSSLQY